MLTGLWLSCSARQRNVVSALVVIHSDGAADRLPAGNIVALNCCEERDVRRSVAIEITGYDGDWNLIHGVEHRRTECTVSHAGQ